MTDQTLTDHDRRLLDFEREWWKYAGEKTVGIRTEFDLDQDQYHRQLDKVIATDAAMAHDPMLVKRLRRLAAQRRRQQARNGGGGAA